MRTPLFDQPPRHQTPAPEIAIAVSRARLFGLFGDVERFGRFRLHPVRDFRRLNARFELRVLPVALRGACWFSLPSRSSCRRCSSASIALIVDVLNQLVRIFFAVRDVSALVDRGKKRRSPELRATTGSPGTAPRNRAGSGSPCPSPYVSHEPIEGRPANLSPAFIMNSEGS